MSKEYNIGIVGYGVVGKGIHSLFGDNVKAIYDPYVEKSATPGTAREKEAFADLDLAVLSVMTKQNKDWTCDASIVDKSLAWLQEIGFKGVALIKSAVVPTEIARLMDVYSDLRMVVSPEFMGESKYYTPPWNYPDPQDMRGHTWQIFGGDKKDTSLCVDIFKRKMGVDTQFMQTDAITASLTKYMENSFFAMKVTFCNEWADIAEAFGVDYNELRELWLADPRINKNHTLVFPKDRGYGGKCFPKDVRAIIRSVGDVGYEAKLMRAVDEVNTEMREK